MNIKEIVRNIQREIIDPFKGVDSNPEHIASFPAHLVGCSRTKALIVDQHFRALPSLYSPNFVVDKVTTSCPECSGSITWER